jgi:hypothetical protein
MRAGIADHRNRQTRSDGESKIQERRACLVRTFLQSSRPTGAYEVLERYRCGGRQTTCAPPTGVRLGDLVVPQEGPTAGL